MKTQIIKTSFWKDDKIYQLSIDAKLLYLCLLTNPEKNTTPAFKVSDRMLSIQTGFNINQIEVAKKVLVELELIKFVEGYFIINDQDFVKAAKGKLSAHLYEKDITSLPENIQILLLSDTGAPQEYNNKDKDNNNNKDINKENFDLFWLEYPVRKSDKSACLTLFKSYSRATQEQIIEDVKKRKIEHAGWVKENFKFTPAPINYLKRKRWEDEIEAITNIKPNITTYE